MKAQTKIHNSLSVHLNKVMTSHQDMKETQLQNTKPQDQNNPITLKILNQSMTSLKTTTQTVKITKSANQPMTSPKTTIQL